MRARDRRQTGGDRLRGLVVVTAIRLRERVDDGEDEIGAETAGEPGEGAAAEARTQARQPRAKFTQPLSPELSMRLLYARQPLVDLGDLRVRFDFGEGAIERRAVDLALQVGAISRLRVALRHASLSPNQSGSFMPRCTPGRAAHVAGPRVRVVISPEFSTSARRVATTGESAK